MASAAQVGSRHTTTIAPRCGKEWQSRATRVAAPVSAAIAPSAALRIDQIDGEFRSLSKGVDDAPGDRIVSAAVQMGLKHDCIEKETANAGTNSCRRLLMVAGGGFEPPTFGL